MKTTIPSSAALTMAGMMLLAVPTGKASAQAAEPAPATPTTAAFAAPAAAPKPDVDTKPGKHKKDVYTGPTEIIELAPTPMLDEEAKQRLDPDGKPMFSTLR